MKLLHNFPWLWWLVKGLAHYYLMEELDEYHVFQQDGDALSLDGQKLHHLWIN